MNCVWIEDSGNQRIKTCARGCGNRLVTDMPVERCHAECAKSPDGPPLRNRAVNFVKAVIKQLPLAADAIIHADESIAFRDQEEVGRIFAICKACPLFNGEVCTHPDCGCAIDAKRTAFLSKLAWRSQKCPDDPPRWS